MPWGISESAYAFTDRAGNYQYKAFGVPGLGLKRGLADELVVSPYSTALAGLDRSRGGGVELDTPDARPALDGRFGFYESIDYRPRKPAADARADRRQRSAGNRARLFRPSSGHVARRAHQRAARRHLRDAIPRRSARQGDRAAAAGTRATRGDSRRGAAGGGHHAPCRRRARRPRGGFARRTRRSPHTHFLSNGRYTVALTHAGGGSSTWRGLSVTRRREDRTSDAGAHFIYLRDPWSGDVWSPTYQPICREPDEYEATFELEKGTFRRRDGDFETRLQVVVSPEDDVEVRRLSITNRGDRPREIEVTSYAEIVLARPEDDLAHPAFGKLFIETEYDAQSAGLLFSRRPRSAEEAHAWAFHVLAVDGRLGGAVEWETDRARFLGRGRSTGPPVGPRRPRAVGHDRRRPRSGGGACASACGWRPARSCASRSPPASRSDRDDGARAGAEVPRCQRRGARLLDGLDARAHHAAASRPDRRSGDAVRSAGLARLRIGCVVHEPRRHRAEHLRPVESVGPRHLRRPADRARPRRRRQRDRARRGSCCTRRSTGGSRICAPISSS